LHNILGENIQAIFHTNAPNCPSMFSKNLKIPFKTNNQTRLVDIIVFFLFFSLKKRLNQIKWEYFFLNLGLW
jgi:hypothetical protein